MMVVVVEVEMKEKEGLKEMINLGSLWRNVCESMRCNNDLFIYLISYVD